MPQEKGMLTLLRKFQPFQLVVTLATGDDKTIPIPPRKQKWAKACEILEALEWTRVEFQDKHGGTLGITDAETEAVDPLAGVPQSKEADLLRMMIKAQDVALSHHHKAMATVLEGNKMLIENLSDRLMLMEKNYADILQLARQAAETIHAPDGDDDMGKQLALAVLSKSGFVPPGFGAPPPPRKVKATGGNGE